MKILKKKHNMNNIGENSEAKVPYALSPDYEKKRCIFSKKGRSRMRFLDPVRNKLFISDLVSYEEKKSSRLDTYAS